MLQVIIIASSLLPAAANEESAPATKPKPTKITIVMRGARSDEDVKVLSTALKQVKGIKFEADDVEPGNQKFKRSFTKPFVVTIADQDKTNVGSLATAVSKATTKSRQDYPPGVSLVIYTDEVIDEPAIMNLRSSLRTVNGVEVDKPGGLGGMPKDGWCWVQLENAGGAALSEIDKKAAESGLKFRRLKKKNSQ